MKQACARWTRIRGKATLNIPMPDQPLSIKKIDSKKDFKENSNTVKIEEEKFHCVAVAVVEIRVKSTPPSNLPLDG